MKPDWDALADEFKDSTTVVVADVDCTAAGEPLCSRFRVEGFPTLKTFSPPSTEGEDYEDGRKLDELRAHVQSLGPGCTPDTKAMCTAEDLAELESLIGLPAEALEAEIAELKAKMTAASRAHEELLESLQAQFETSEQAVQELKRSVTPRLKLLRAAYGGDYPRCEDDASFEDQDGDGCAGYAAKPDFQCGHPGYEDSCTRCCATCSGTPKCKRLADKAPGTTEALKDEV
jgi:hypothetical protein